MRVIVVGLGNQGRKRLRIASSDVVATVDPVNPDASHTSTEQVSLDDFDAALICTPDPPKIALMNYLLSHGKHVLVEKPLLSATTDDFIRLSQVARSTGAACYTAYNHRFEPHLVRLKELLDRGSFGAVYFAKLFYGNGTALDVRRSSWRDQGLGVLADLGSHLLDLTLFLFGTKRSNFNLWTCNTFENKAWDHVLFGSFEKPMVELEATLLSWRNTFAVDVFAESGSIHMSGLCKWGPSTLALRRRVLPSGKPDETLETVEAADPTWALEYEHFKALCRAGGTNIENDIWINAVLSGLERTARGRLAL